MNTKNFIQKFFLLLSACALLLPFGAVAADNPNAEVEVKLREYFKDTAVMIEIAKCESGFRQFGSDGQVLKDATESYIGLFQIDEQVHFMNAWGKNLNLYTLEGNLGYARHLYENLGTVPWQGCVPKGEQLKKSADNTTPPSDKITKNLRMGQSDPQIKLLQQILNKSGFEVANAGPGSPGQETEMFGKLTREAIRKFQCAKKIVCGGNESTTGYGRVGPMTRKVLDPVAGP